MINNISMIRDNDFLKKEEGLIKSVLNSLRIKNNAIKAEPLNHHWDFSFRGADGDLNLVEVKKMIPFRHNRTYEIISYLQLLGQKDAKRIKNVWLILVVDNLTEQKTNQIKNFCDDVGIGINIVFVDIEGEVVWIKKEGFFYENLLGKDERFLEDIKISKVRVNQKKDKLVFTNNQQWVLKHLILNGIDEKYWGFKKNKRLIVSTELSDISGVAQSSCYNTIKALENEKYLVPTSHSFKMRNLKELMEKWKLHLESQKKIEFFAMPQRAGVNSDDWWVSKRDKLYEIQSNLNCFYAVGGGAACEWYRLKVSADLSVILHLASNQRTTLDHFCSLFSLARVVEPQKIKIVLHKYNKPIVGAVEEKPEKAPYVDILQAAFDSLEFGGRGLEQSEKLFEKIIYKFWLDKGWSL